MTHPELDQHTAATLAEGTEMNENICVPVIPNTEVCYSVSTMSHTLMTVKIIKKIKVAECRVKKV